MSGHSSNGQAATEQRLYVSHINVGSFIKRTGRYRTEIGIGNRNRDRKGLCQIDCLSHSINLCQQGCQITNSFVFLARPIAGVTKGNIWFLLLYVLFPVISPSYIYTWHSRAWTSAAKDKARRWQCQKSIKEWFQNKMFFQDQNKIWNESHRQNVSPIA
jgi:hypothetical protein